MKQEDPDGWAAVDWVDLRSRVRQIIRNSVPLRAVEDLVQEVMTDLVSRFDRKSAPLVTDPSAFAAKVSFHHCRRWHRRRLQRPWTVHLDPDRLAHLVEAHEPPRDWDALAKLLPELRASLTARDQEVFDNLFSVQRSIKKSAQVLGLQPHHVRRSFRRILRAASRLRKRFHTWWSPPHLMTDGICTSTSSFLLQSGESAQILYVRVVERSATMPQRTATPDVVGARLQPSAIRWTRTDVGQNFNRLFGK